MSNLVVITFDNVEEAGKVRNALRQAQKRGALSLDDSAVIVKYEEGKIHVKGEVDRGVKIGALGGSLLGLLLAGIFFPFAGIIIGALGGAAVGAMADLGISKKFVKQVGDELKPNTSALFVIVHKDSDPDMVQAILRPYKGTVYQTSLDTQAEENLRNVLSKRIGVAPQEIADEETPETPEPSEPSEAEETPEAIEEDAKDVG